MTLPNALHPAGRFAFPLPKVASMDLLEQKAETEAVFAELAASGDLPVSASVDYQFTPESDDADWDALTEAAEAKGYEVSWFQDDAEDERWIEMSVPDLPVTLDAIWDHEERLTLLAAVHGFVPAGWGLYADEDGASDED
jgi:hypothetical protein